jgi:hypothetical protein
MIDQVNEIVTEAVSSFNRGNIEYPGFIKYPVVRRESNNFKLFLPGYFVNKIYKYPFNTDNCKIYFEEGPRINFKTLDFFSNSMRLSIVASKIARAHGIIFNYYWSSKDSGTSLRFSNGLFRNKHALADLFFFLRDFFRIDLGYFINDKRYSRCIVCGRQDIYNDFPVCRVCFERVSEEFVREYMKTLDPDLFKDFKPKKEVSTAYNPAFYSLPQTMALFDLRPMVMLQNTTSCIMCGYPVTSTRFPILCSACSDQVYRDLLSLAYQQFLIEEKDLYEKEILLQFIGSD